MKLLFLCGGLEPGRDGVGDYTRRLAGECIRMGHEASICALNDRSVVEFREQDAVHQHDGETAITVWRCPHTLSWEERRNALSSIIRRTAPDTVSLQFVPYSFHVKGLPYQFVAMMGSLARELKVRWHVMFHELWVGLGHPSKMKLRLLGHPQRWLIKRLLKALRPAIVHTQTTPYRQILAKHCACKVGLLPLFSNIPVISAPEETPSAEAGPIRLAFFGTVHPQWDPEDAARALLAPLKDTGQALEIIALGRGGMHAETTWNRFRSVSSQISVIETGQIPAKAISAHLHASHFGLSSLCPDLMEKSGSAIAMFEHGLPTIFTRPPIWGQSYVDAIQQRHPLAITAEAIDTYPQARKQPPRSNALSATAREFLGAVSDSAHGA